MRAPPPAGIEVHDDLRWRVVQALLAALAGGSASQFVLSWLALERPLPAWLSAGVVGAVALLAAAWMAWHARQPSGRLTWSGSQWRWQPRGEPLAADLLGVDAMIDLGGWILLRLRFAARRRALWIACRRPGEATSWAAFRAAVYSSDSRSLGGFPVEPPRP
ncbi:MAG: hypothetical protein JNJ71_02750 [Rubrivivax sp.]|nr:hypothetical protein [Rubrivivax sp.]